MSREAGIARWHAKKEAKAEAWAAARGLLKQHIPFISDEDEEVIYGLAVEPDSTAADYAVRTCACGVKIDGFYQYVDHLEAVLATDALQQPLPLTGA